MLIRTNEIIHRDYPLEVQKMRQQLIMADLMKNVKGLENLAQEVIQYENRRCEIGC